MGERCCIRECIHSQEDILEGLSVIIAKTTPEPTRIPVCKRHIGFGYQVKADLERGQICEIAIPELLITRSKIVELQRQAEAVIRRATADWEWVEEFDEWMSTDGHRVRITKLPSEEIVDAIIAITRANFEKLPNKLKWTKKLFPQNVHKYPEDALTPPKKTVLAKLEEMQEALRLKGLNLTKGQPNAIGNPEDPSRIEGQD